MCKLPNENNKLRETIFNNYLKNGLSDEDKKIYKNLKEERIQKYYDDLLEEFGLSDLIAIVFASRKKLQKHIKLYVYGNRHAVYLINKEALVLTLCDNLSSASKNANKELSVTAKFKKDKINLSIDYIGQPIVPACYLKNCTFLITAYNEKQRIKFNINAVKTSQTATKTDIDKYLKDKFSDINILN